jgi:HD-GYP domain-containing protein (c-di-GMP phosphodiesterase class II)
LAIADSFDAMTEPRPYRKPLSYGDAIEEIKKNAGLQFDPALVDAFLECASELRQ